MSSFDIQVENSGRTVQYKLNAQSLRLFGLDSDVNDAHRASANRLQKQTNYSIRLLHIVKDQDRRGAENLITPISPKKLHLSARSELVTDIHQITLHFLSRPVFITNYMKLRYTFLTR